MVFHIKIKLEYWEKLTETYEKYQKINEALGLRFYLAADTVIERIEENPFLYQIRYKNYRQALLKGFPYQVIYEIVENEVIVYTLFPAKDNPDKKPS